MKFRFPVIYTFCLLFALLCLSMTGTAQQSNDSVAMAHADTSHFSVNDAGNWELFNSYVAAYAADSVQLEAIVQHSNDIDWTAEQLIGYIKDTTLLPRFSQVVFFNLLNDVYQVRAEPDGSCYLRFVSGSLPDGSPAVIPVKVYYKR